MKELKETEKLLREREKKVYISVVTGNLRKEYVSKKQ